jgi:uncharacterized protein
MLRKSLDVEIKGVDGDPGTATAYVAVFGNVDRQGEVIQPGAFTNLESFVKDGWIALSHDFAELPVATVESAMQDEKGLLLSWRWHTTDDAQECRTVVRERMERGKAVKCSIGYRVLDAAPETRDGGTVYVLKRIELFEASIVNLPANPKAEVVGVKSWADGLEEAYLALKEGRVLSSKNRARLERLAAQCREAATDLDAMLQETAGAVEAPKGADAPGQAKAVEQTGADDGRRLVASFLAHCAEYPSYRFRS